MMKQDSISETKPNFFIIGAPNSGTTSLWHLLRQHPEIFMPETKEPRFFTRSDYENQWDWYDALFENVEDEKAIGEASVNYSETHIWPETPSRIAKHLPEARIVYIVRHPLRRMESCWRQALSTGHWYKRFYTDQKMPLNFNKAVREYPHFLSTTRYWQHLNAFREYFPDDQILLLFFEDFIAEPQSILGRCFEFLEVDTHFLVEGTDAQRNAGATKKMVRPILVKMRIVKLLGWIQSCIPAMLQGAIGRLLRKPVPSSISWEQETKQWVIDQLYEDINSILEYGGKPSDFWGSDEGLCL